MYLTWKDYEASELDTSIFFHMGFFSQEPTKWNCGNFLLKWMYSPIAFNPLKINVISLFHGKNGSTLSSYHLCRVEIRCICPAVTNPESLAAPNKKRFIHCYRWLDIRFEMSNVPLDLSISLLETSLHR